MIVWYDCRACIVCAIVEWLDGMGLSKKKAKSLKKAVQPNPTSRLPLFSSTMSTNTREKQEGGSYQMARRYEYSGGENTCVE